MISNKIKIGGLIKSVVIVLSLSSILVMSSSAGVSALSLKSENVVASVNNINCSYNLNPLTWLICPLIDGMSALVEGFDGYITSALDINVCTYFNSTGGTDQSCASPNCVTNPVVQTTANQDSCTSKGFYTAWSAFRDMSLGLMVIGALFMVISQAIGFEVFDAYTIRKVLPRIIIAAIGISLSWQLVQFLIQFSNDLGNGISSLIYSPFSVLLNTGVVLKGGTSSAAFILGAGAIATLGIMASLTFVLVAVVAAFLGFAIIILRQILIVFLAIMAPLAIAMFILPATEKVWKLWWNTFFKALLMFPLIIGMIAIGRVFAAISSQNGGNIGQFIAFIAYFGPYFIIPQTFKFAGGILAAAGGAASKANKSFGKSMAGYRAKKKKEISEKRQAGNTRLTSGRTGNLYRRVTGGGLGLSSTKRARFQAKEQMRTRALAENALKQDGGAMGGDDIATGLAMDGSMTGGKFLSQYAEQYKKKNIDSTDQEAQSHARSALAGIQTNFGTKFGTPNMMLAAATAHIANSPAAYGKDDAGLGSMYKDVGQLVKRGVITDQDGARMIKANKLRPDQSAASFQDVLSAVQKSAATGSGPTISEIANLRDSAFIGSDPSDFIKAHSNSVEALIPTMLNRLGAAVGTGNQDQIDTELARIDGITSAGGAASTKIADILSSKLFSEEYTDLSSGGKINIRQAIELRRGSEAFRNQRPGGGMMPMPSDIRLKENIVFVGIYSGFKFYSFNYINSHITYVGVIAQEILEQVPAAITINKNGYYFVDYQMLGLKMYKLSEWNETKTQRENQNKILN
jgi:hypothetical protein